MVFLLFYGWKISNRLSPLNYPSEKKLKLFHLILGVCGICGMTFLGLRGGIQPIPLQLVDAGRYTSPQYVGLVLNTPFTIIRSFESSRLPELQLEKNDEALRYIQPVQQFNNKDFKNKNVVVLILEGFSKEYTGISNRKSLTPFLDSLMQHSLVFTNAWANGKQSIEGIPAVLSSIPSLMDNPYINSVYCNNKTNSLAQLLEKKGYTSAFFHGGINGTMNFDSYSKTAGFEKYFGKKEYNNDKDFDGNWGIWDEPYLQYFASELNKQPIPFFASIFTLSSHHPFNLPEKYKNRFINNGLEISQTIGYTDNALRLFFASAKKTNWYKNTLFVLVPDHTGISSDPFYANPVGQHSIPIIFFSPAGEFKGKSNTLIQQTDLLPTILDTLGFNLPFFSFGKSAFTTKKEHFALFYDSGNFYSLNDSMCFIFSNQELKRVYNFKNDSSLQRNIEGKYPVEEQKAKKYFRNFAQLYNHTLNSNTTFYDSK
jgi:phosphoglycerol transferase MdoB-like AlkP superfamily enzyme